MKLNMDIQWFVSVAIITFLVLMIVNYLFKDYFKLNPFYRNKILLEGFDASGNAVTDPSGNAAPSNVELGSSLTPSTNVEPSSSAPAPSGTSLSGSEAPSSTVPAPLVTEAPSNIAVTPSSTTPSSTAVTPSSTVVTPSSTVVAPSVPDTSNTDKSTIMADLFDKVNSQMDIIRTIQLSDKIVPITIDKTAVDPFIILSNLKLLINNGIYKNELDIKDVYKNYIGNKEVQLLTSDINSVNLESQTDSVTISNLETSFLKRCQSIVDAHQKLIEKILDNKSKE
jgi:hypothetical protein